LGSLATSGEVGGDKKEGEKWKYKQGKGQSRRAYLSVKKGTNRISHGQSLKGKGKEGEVGAAK